MSLIDNASDDVTFGECYRLGLGLENNTFLTLGIEVAKNQCFRGSQDADLERVF